MRTQCEYGLGASEAIIRLNAVEARGKDSVFGQREGSGDTREKAAFVTVNAVEARGKGSAAAAKVTPQSEAIRGRSVGWR